MNIKHVKPDNFYHVFVKGTGLVRSKCVGRSEKQIKFWMMKGSSYIKNEDGTNRVFRIKANMVKKFKSSTVSRTNEYNVVMNDTVIAENVNFSNGLKTYKANIENAEDGDSLELIKIKTANGKECDITVREYAPDADEVTDAIEAAEANVEAAEEVFAEEVIADEVIAEENAETEIAEENAETAE